MEIHGGYRVFECAERSFNPPYEVVYLFDRLRCRCTGSGQPIRDAGISFFIKFWLDPVLKSDLIA